MQDFQTRLTELAARVEAGETVVVTRDGKAAFELRPTHHQDTPGTGGVNWQALEDFKEERGIKRFVSWISDDFDDPLPEDFLLQPLPPDQAAK